MGSFPPLVQHSDLPTLRPWPERKKRILGLALPMIGGMVSQNILNLVDTAMVGSLGDYALGGVGIGGMVNFVLSAFVLGMATGVQTMASRRMGEGKEASAAVPLNGGLMLAMCVAIPWSIVIITWVPNFLPLLMEDPRVFEIGESYLQIRLVAMVALGMNFAFRAFWNATNRPMLYMKTLIFMHIVNIGLNWLLIFGHFGLPKMGADGAALGSTISTFVGTFVYLGLGFKHARKNGFLSGIPPLSDFGRMLKLGVPTGVQQMFFASGLTAFLWIVGKVGTSELAATQVVINILLVGILPGMGFGLASATLVGQALGRGDATEAKRWGWDVMSLATVAVGGFALFPLFFPRLVLSVFLHNPETLELAVWPLRLAMISLFADTAGNVLMHSLNGAGATGRTTVVTVSLQWFLFLPVAYAVGPWLGIGFAAIWVTQAATRFLQTLVFLGMWEKGSWASIKV